MSNINQQRAIFLSQQISFFLFLFFSVVFCFSRFCLFSGGVSRHNSRRRQRHRPQKNITSIFFGRLFFCGRCRWQRRLLWRLTPPRQADGNGRDWLAASGTAYADRQTRPAPDTTNNRTKQP